MFIEAAADRATDGAETRVCSNPVGLGGRRASPKIAQDSSEENCFNTNYATASTCGIVIP